MIRFKTPEVKGSPMLSEYINGLAVDLHKRYKRDFNSKEEYEKHREDVVKKLRESVGLDPFPERNPLNPRIVGRFEKDDYAVEKVIFEARTGYLINAVIFIPQNVSFPVPAILNPRGHWKDKYQEEEQLRCIQLARKGFIALTYDPIGQGERVWLGSHEDIRRQAKLAGHSLSGMMFWDTIRCMDYLYTRPDVDKNGVGCIGLSGGGFNTIYTSILDNRIKASIPTVFATNFEMLIRRNDAGCCAYLVNHAIYGEIDDMYACIAPTPLLILAGGKEDEWLSGGAYQNYNVASNTYKLYGIDRLEVFVDETVGHTLSKPMRERMYYWFNKWLKGDDDPENAKEDYVPEIFDREKRELDVFSNHDSKGKSIFEINKELVTEFQKGWLRPKVQSDIKNYQVLLRDNLFKILGDISEFNVIGKVIDTENDNEYSIENIQLITEANITIPAQLYKPNKYISGIILYIRTDEKDNSLQPLEQSLEQFLILGYAVLFVRVRGTWETNYKLENESNSKERDVELYSLALGKSLFSVRIYDLLQSIDYIKSRDDTKNLPITFVGEGLREGLLGIYLTALDDRISSLITNGGLISYQYFIDNSLYPPHEFFIPHILRYADTPEMIASIAPRNVCLINASGIITDRNGNKWQEGNALPLDVVNKTFEWTKRVYELSGAPDKFRIISGRIAYEIL